MSDETERDDTILGTALSRAVESQHPRETPYERSRLATRLAAPARSSFWPALAAAATFVAAVGLAAFVLLPRGAPAEPSPSAPVVVPTNTPAATVTPTSLPTTALRVFFARDQLPPLGAEVQVPLAAPAGPEQRVRARLDALATAKASGGAMNMVPTLRTHPVLKDVRIDGDLVTVDYTVPNGDWGSAGSAGTLALIQQLVYTASEEPGIRRVLITENGGKATIIDQVQIDHPVTREDVFGYSFKGTEVTSIVNDGTDRGQVIDAWSVSNGAATNGVPGILGRVSVQVRDGGPPCETSAPCHGRLDPSFRANTSVVDAKDCAICAGGKWRIVLTLPATSIPSQPTTTLDLVGGPIRGVDGQVATTGCVAGPSACPPSYAVISIYLDDQRPWRVSVEPTGDGTARINVDIGGRPQQVNKNIAVYAPQPGDATARTFTITGAARVFEANVVWRVKDGRGNEVATGHTLASIGTSPVWGTFTTRVDVPAGVSGNVTLEVFHASPMDGSDQDLVEIPLTIR